MSFLLIVGSFLKAHWRPVAVLAVAVSLFVAGRFSAPKPTVTVKTETKTVYKDRVVTVEKQAEAKTKNVVVYRDRVVTRPDGTKVETKTQVTAKVDDKKTDDTHVVSTSTGSADSTKVSVTSDAPRLNMSLGAGIRFAQPDAPLILLQANYRLVGPLTLGGWGMFDTKWANGALGLSIGVAF